MKKTTTNQTYKLFCIINKLDSNVRVCDMSKENINLFADFITEMETEKIVKVLIWLLDEDCSIGWDRSELEANTCEFLQDNRFIKYREQVLDNIDA